MYIQYRQVLNKLRCNFMLYGDSDEFLSSGLVINLSQQKKKNLHLGYQPRYVATYNINVY